MTLRLENGLAERWRFHFVRATPEGAAHLNTLTSPPYCVFQIIENRGDDGGWLVAIAETDTPK